MLRLIKIIYLIKIRKLPHKCYPIKVQLSFLRIFKITVMPQILCSMKSNPNSTFVTFALLGHVGGAYGIVRYIIGSVIGYF